jgi:arabinofuranosyltransferase
MSYFNRPFYWLYARMGAGYGLFVILALTFLLVQIANAWMAEDAFIIFRTVDNFIHGYGLRWNVQERVQSFTTPLWTLLLCGFSFITREQYYTVSFLSILLATGSFVFLCVWVQNPFKFSFIFLTLISSRAYFDYSSSGLENVLAYALILCFYYFLFGYRKDDTSKLYALCFLACAVMLTRLDLGLLVIPAVIWVLIKHREIPYLKRAMIFANGFSPLLFWHLFSLFYYGFIFPNTAYAKLFNGLERYDAIKAGIFYIYVSAVRDPVTVMGIVFFSLLLILRYRRDTTKDPVLLICLFSILLYVIYVVMIGGDYMNGRFLGVPFFSVSVLFIIYRPAIHELGILGMCFVISHCFLLYSVVHIDPAYCCYWERRTDYFIDDEKGYFFKDSGLINNLVENNLIHSHWAKLGRIAYKERKNTPLVIMGNIGLYGYFAGPEVHIVDKYGLADAFLARRRPQRNLVWLSGHFMRNIPQGYIASLKSGINQFRSPVLRDYYEKLRLVTRGPLFSVSRLKSIWELNTGIWISQEPT